MHKIEDLIGSADAAEKLNIDRSTLSRWATAGKITPALRGAGSRGEKFFHTNEIEALAAELAAGPAPAPKRVAS